MKRSFSLVELIVVVAIVGIGIGLFYSVLVVNWVSLEKQVSLVDLQMEADKISEAISADGRLARLITITGAGKNVLFSLPADLGPTVTYSIAANGEISKDSGSGSYVISRYLDYNSCSFAREGNALLANLSLVDDVFGQRLRLAVSIRIFPRNLL